MITMISPDGSSGTYGMQDGTQVIPGADGTVSVAPGYVLQLLALGFTPLSDGGNGPTSGRPTQNLVPGLHWFDSTLGIPIWRNAANTGWVNASGTLV